MQIIIGGDLVPTKSNVKLFSESNLKSLLGNELLDIWDAADVRIFNLEVPLADEETPIFKNGPNLIAPTKSIKGIKALNPTVLTLANNHILDQGEKGLKRTMDLLKENEIPFVGAGNKLTEASKPYLFERDGIRVGVYACAENEFSIARDDTAGANPFNPLESLDHIDKLKKECDYLIVLYHGGKEHYRYPSPNLQRVCRKIVEKGADFIVCQHSHCIGSYEEYNGSTIVYGQGNFIFDYSENVLWNTSILIQIDIEKDVKINYVPIEKDKNGIKVAIGNEKKEILNEFNERSNNIKNEQFVNMKFKELAKDNQRQYLYTFSNFGRIFRNLDRILFRSVFFKYSYNKNKRIAMQNYLECESHRDLLLEIVKQEER